ncbi:uncharacterized protein LOC126095359 [Schistocerca cancellata]|uniref:uncharacterized protein LOC126095359 n=1 Tax=Schistocerca cancellata TaxID=274614 RepID=UPI002117E5FA|nr:uncharacterized protein LOC126095359 [Schistocerca cancellata]
MADRLCASRPSQIRKKKKRKRDHHQEKVKHKLIVCQVNIEGSSGAERDLLSKIMNDNKVDVLALQETHLTDDNISKIKVHGFTTVAYSGHEKLGIATPVRNNLLSNITKIKSSHDFTVGIKVNDMTTFNVYKPPSSSCSPSMLPVTLHPSVYITDFDSHHFKWGYNKNNSDGVCLADWAETNNYHLLYDARDKPTFHSSAWKTKTTPDLCFVSITNTGAAMPASQTVLNCLSRSQHCPVLIKVGLQLQIVTSPPIPRCNLSKSNWEAYRESVEKTVMRIPPTAANYARFCNLLIHAAHKNIPRGARKYHIPCWSEECSNLLEEQKMRALPRLLPTYWTRNENKDGTS